MTIDDLKIMSLKMTHAQAEALRLNATQRRVVQVMRDNPRITTSEQLAKRIGLSQSSAAKHLTACHDKGYLSRKRGGGPDGAGTGGRQYEYTLGRKHEPK